MSQERPNPEDLMNAYLDGELDEETVTLFEAELAQNPAMRERVEKLQAIEAGSRRLHGQGAHAEDVPVMPRSQATFRFPMFRVVAYASALLLVGGLWFVLSRAGATARPDGAAIYAEVLAADFQPTDLCDTSEKFTRYTMEAYGEEITADFESDIEFVGWRYPGNEYGGARVLLARAPDGTKVIAIFQERGAPAPRLADSSNLRRFRAVVGPVVVHEISPLEHPVLLDAISGGG